MSETVSSAKPVISCTGLSKAYQQGRSEIEIFDNISIDIFPGDTVAIIGASGSGKSTLLNLLGGLDSPSKGRIELAGSDLTKMSESAKASQRNQHLGFVYQFHHLLPEFTALENVAMPLLLRTLPVSQAKSRAEAYLKQVGLGHRLQHKPGALSGGERQRVAIARALVTEPSCVMMDEPTGNLDPNTADQVSVVLQDLVDRLAIAFVLVTHDHALARTMQTVYSLEHGALKPAQFP